MILVPLSDENIKRSSGIEALRCSEAWMKLNLRNLLIRTWLKILKHCTSNIHSVTDREPRRLLLANSFDWARKSTASFFKAFDRLFVYQAYQEPAENFNRSADEFVHLKIQKRQNFQKNLYNIRKVLTFWHDLKLHQHNKTDYWGNKQKHTVSPMHHFKATFSSP